MDGIKIILLDETSCMEKVTFLLRGSRKGAVSEADFCNCSSCRLVRVANSHINPPMQATTQIAIQAFFGIEANAPKANAKIIRMPVPLEFVAFFLAMVRFHP